MNRGRDRLLLVWLALLVVGVAVPLAVVAFRAQDGDEADRAGADGAVPEEWSIDPYRGFGAWVDVFDWAPSYQEGGGEPVIRPRDLEIMAASGVETVYLQAAGREFADVVDPELAADFLVEAHELGMAVVAWYLPRFEDLDAELDRLEAIFDFGAGGHRFDGIAVDIEWTDSVEDDDERSDRLVELSEALDDVVDGAPLGAIVLPPLLIEEVNPQFWPDFPWRRLEDVYDVWLPMSYWSFRTEASGLADPVVYTVENNDRLRELLGDDVPLHVIGGVGDVATASELRAFAEAVADEDVIGASVYDYRSMTLGEWSVLVGELAGALAD